MLVAVCEDERGMSREIVTYCKEWEMLHKDCPLTIHVYETPETLLNAHEHPLDYDLFFLDIEFGHNSSMNGYRLSEIIREHNRTSVIVFITNSKNYMLQGYQVYAYRYLLKPVSEANIFDCLDHCVIDMLSGSDPFLSLVKKDGISRIRIKEIILVENGLHSVTILKSSGTETARIYESFEDYITSFPAEWFVRIQRGLIVNVLYITRFTKDTIYLSTGVDYLIGRRYRSSVYERLLQFFTGGRK